jgi:hypothetical protein
MIDIPWGIAVSADLAFPGVAGHRSTKVRLVNTYHPPTQKQCVRLSDIPGSGNCPVGQCCARSRQRRSGDIGSWWGRSPVASRIALASAGATGL